MRRKILDAHGIGYLERGFELFISIPAGTPGLSVHGATRREPICTQRRSRWVPFFFTLGWHPSEAAGCSRLSPHQRTRRVPFFSWFSTRAGGPRRCGAPGGTTDSKPSCPRLEPVIPLIPILE